MCLDFWALHFALKRKVKICAWIFGVRTVHQRFLLLHHKDRSLHHMQIFLAHVHRYFLCKVLCLDFGAKDVTSKVDVKRRASITQEKMLD